ncbi:MAG: 3-oxoacyl-[acyl-carrier-protein] synthase, partial [Thermoleophilaceae bacterium]|nr:3-oxoacyl-[acyl-carrier-protein] synthase [Thermoleophilaceae bacterium]
MKDVVVTGMGAVTPLGAGAGVLFDRWAAGELGIRDGEAPCADFEPLDYFSRKEARRADRFTQFALASAQEALGQAGWIGELPYAPGRIGCIVGTGIGGIGTLEANFGVLHDKGPEMVAPLAVPLMMGNAGSAAIAMSHDLRGPVFGVVSACAAGANAIAAATRTIQVGDADAMVTGGSEAGLTALARAAFSALDATSTTGICRPFDVRRDGFIMGEGAGVLVLEDAELARARGATILATIRGVGQSSDAHHLTAPRADGSG